MLSHEGILFLFAGVIWFKFSFFPVFENWIGLSGNQTAMGPVFFLFLVMYIRHLSVGLTELISIRQ